ncbi:MAG TPA: hypothetical protein VFZ83_09255 [Acidimicrobiia bacterium]|nr:hypothetical protein [Acidimicrobiia bacterium]
MTRTQRIALAIGAALVVIIAAVVIAVAVSDDDDETASSTSTEATTTTAAATTTTVAPTTPPTTTCASPDGATTERKEGPPSGAMLLNGVEIASTSSGCTDTVVFTFTTNSAPEEAGYSVEYQSGPFTQDASGEPVSVDGAAFLVVRLEPAYGYDFETGETTYDGPKEFRPTGTRYVRHAVNTGDFEAVVSWVIGLSEERPFRVLAAGAPERQLIVEIG